MVSWLLFFKITFSFRPLCVLYTDSSSDDASIPEERIATPDREYNYPRDHLSNSRDKMKLPSQRDRHQNSNISDRRHQNLPPPPVNKFSTC